MSPFIPSLPLLATDADYEAFAGAQAAKVAPDFLKDFNPQAYERNLQSKTRELITTAQVARDVIAERSRNLERWTELEPNSIAQSVGLDPKTRIEVYGNRLDEYGFADGTEKFVSELRERSHDVTMQMNENGSHLSEVEDVKQAQSLILRLLEKNSNRFGKSCRSVFN